MTGNRQPTLDAWCAWCDLYKNDAETPPTCPGRDTSPDHVWVVPLAAIAAALAGIENQYSWEHEYDSAYAFALALTDARHVLGVPE